MSRNKLVFISEYVNETITPIFRSEYVYETSTPIFRMAKGSKEIAELLKKLNKQKSNANIGKKNG